MCSSDLGELGGLGVGEFARRRRGEGGGGQQDEEEGETFHAEKLPRSALSANAEYRRAPLGVCHIKEDKLWSPLWKNGAHGVGRRRYQSAGHQAAGQAGEARSAGADGGDGARTWRVGAGKGAAWPPAT